jgi:hypothetical protein
LGKKTKIWVDDDDEEKREKKKAKGERPAKPAGLQSVGQVGVHSFIANASVLKLQ